MTRRDWTEARRKVESEGRCRACGATLGLQAAHIIPRSRVRYGGEHPDNILPLCGECHSAQHAGHLELLPLLTHDEQVYAVTLCHGIEEARRRLTNQRAA